MEKQRVHHNLRKDKHMILFHEMMKPQNLSLRVVEYESQKEWLDRIPHKRMEDLALFMTCREQQTDDTVVHLHVTEDICKTMNLDVTEAFQIAEQNMMKEMVFMKLEEMMPCPSLVDTMFSVLTTKSGVSGAALIGCPEALKTVYEQFHDGFYVLPSSVHEVLVAPLNVQTYGLNAEAWLNIVQEVNREVVSPEDRLSDNVYMFDGRILRSVVAKKE